MAENEYLDSSKAQRWQAVAQAIRENRDITEIGKLVLDKFYKTLRNIRKDLPLSELIEAVDDPTKLAHLCSRIHGAQDVKYFLIQAALDESGRQKVLDKFLHDALRNCLSDIPYIACKVGDKVNMSDARHVLDDVQISLTSDLRRIAEKLADNPSWVPKRQLGSHKNVAPKVGTESMLGESLIVGFKK